MFKIIFLSILLSLSIQQSYNISGSCVPFGTRLSYGPYYSTSGNTSNTQIYVTFNTLGNCTGVAYWGNLYVYSQYPCASQYLPFSWVTPNYFQTTVYTCPITGIDYSQSILYTVAGIDSTQEQFLFLNQNISITLDDWNTQQQTSFLVFGDWNYQPVNTSLPYAPISNCLGIMGATDRMKVNGILFTGDMAYDLSSNNGSNYVQLLLMLQPFSSIWPFMATIGNHQQLNSSDITVFTTSFNFPYADHNYYYNFSLGLTTYVSFNPDAVVYFDSNSDQILDLLVQQFKFTLANAPTKYVIPMSHFPFFCSMVSNVSQCTTNNASLYQLQMQFVNSNKVPIYLSAHIHTYERSYPINLLGQVTSTNLYQYSQPQPPVYVIEGAAGNSEYITLGENPYPLLYYTAAQVSGSGYGILTVTQNGDITYNHVIGINCTVADSFIINAQEADGGSSGVGFPIWLIVLLSVVGFAIICGIVWFCWSKKKSSVKQFIDNDLKASYKNMEMKNGV